MAKGQHLVGKTPQNHFGLCHRQQCRSEAGSASPYAV
jgi:hypothetical protein